MANVNGFETAAWSINGARHRGSLLRVANYAGVGGSEGIIGESGGLKVTQNGGGTPQVNIATGAVTFLNRSSGAKSQSYTAMAPLVSSVDIAANGTGATRYDLVIVRAKDPEYAGFTLPGGSDPLTYQYVEPLVIQNVPAGTKDWAAYVTSLGTPYSAYALARIAVPPGGSNITTGMITDLRKIAMPRRERRVMVQYPGVLDTTGATGVREQLSNLNNAIFCPQWATELKLIVTVAAGRYSGNMNGQLRAEYGYGAGDSPTFLFTQDSGLDSSDGTTRSTVVAAGELAIPANYRGKDHNVRISALRTLGTGNFGINEYSTLVIDAEFVEVAD